MPAISRLKPLSAPVLQRLIGPNHPETEILHPQETETVIPPALLPGMLERVVGTDEHSTLAQHIRAAQETTVTHAPVLKQIYRNALVGRAGFATWRLYQRYNTSLTVQALNEPFHHEPVLRYCHSYVAWRYFGHWLTDSLPTALLEPEIGTPWLPPAPAWSHAPPYLEALGFAPINAGLVHADQLIVYQDFSQGSSKRARYARLCKRLHNIFGNATPLLPSSGGNVYIRRGATGVSREIVNEQSIIQDLSARGWTILDIATSTVDEIQTALCRAQVVASIDGSHLDHAHLTLRPHSAMVVLMPQDRFSSRQLGVCRAHDVSIGMVILNRASRQGYHLDMNELLRTVDLAQTSALC